MNTITETTERFELRKQDHIAHSLASENQSSEKTGLDQVELIHEALPDCDFNKIKLTSFSLGHAIHTPFVISSMTAGHKDSKSLNYRLAKTAQERGWAMGVGSQRRELFDPEASKEWKNIRSEIKSLEMYSNIGITQLIQCQIDPIKKITESIQASAIIVHLNPLQEVLQPEGTPNFTGGLKAIEQLVKEIKLPVIVKETGCGFSINTLRRLDQVGVSVIDLSGLGGTHWGRIEGKRALDQYHLSRASETYSNWGISLLDCLLNAKESKAQCEIWASGGLRSGLDSAKAMALGAKRVAFAQPAIKAALDSEETLNKWMQTIEFEFKMALFCTGSFSIEDFSKNSNWRLK